MGMYIPNMKPEQFYELCKEHGLEIIAVPVPPHGKLIDADAILQEATKGEEPFDWIDKNELLRLFFDAPTIIPAEEAET